MPAKLDPRESAWKVLTRSIDGGGPLSEHALELLGAVNYAGAQDLARKTLLNRNSGAAAALAKGLTSDECRAFLPQLQKLVQAGIGSPEPELLSAIARANTPDAARFLGQVVNVTSQSNAGIAFGLLEQLGEVADEVLIGKLTNGVSPWVRETSAYVLLRRGTRTAIPRFRAALNDTDSRVRAAAGLGLASFGISEGRTELKHASNSQEVDDRVEALAALARLGDTNALQQLTQILNDQNASVRGRAVWAVARWNGPELKLLSYKLNLETDPQYAPLLIQRLLDPAEGRDRKVLESYLTGSDLTAALLAADRLVNASVAAPIEGVVARGLQSSDDSIRALAVELAQSHSSIAPLLTEYLDSRDPLLAAAALNAVAQLKVKERIQEVAQRFLTSTAPTVSLAAAKSLVALDPAKAKLIFEQQLDSADPYVRVDSAAMLLTIS